METLNLVATLSLVLVGLFVAILLAGLVWQLWHAFSAWLDATPAPLKSNPVIDGALRRLGLSRMDRATALVWLVVALLTWPVGLPLGFAVIRALHVRERRAFARSQEVAAMLANRPCSVTHNESRHEELLSCPQS